MRGASGSGAHARTGVKRCGARTARILVHMTPVFVESVGPVERSSTDPLLLVDTLGQEWLVKLTGPESRDHLREWLSAAVAEQMGVATPPFGVGRIEESLITALSAGDHVERAFAARVRRQGPHVFASRWLHGAVEPTDLRRLNRSALAGILTFDLLICNPDRTAGHTNLLLHGGRTLAIDHAQAVPWYDVQVEAANIIGPHVATAVGVMPAPCGVTDAELEGVVRSVPRSWWPRADLAERVLDELVARADVLRTGGIP